MDIIEAYAKVDAEILERKVPPAVQGVLKCVRENGHAVALRLNKYGSLRYAVNGARETDALTFIKRFDRGKYVQRSLMPRRVNGSWVDVACARCGGIHGAGVICQPR